MPRRSLLVTIAALLSLAACGGGGSADDDGMTADADAAIGCLEDPRAETFTANMEREGAEGLLTFVLESGDPAPPAKGNNAWTVQVVDADGAPVSGATVTASPFMPDHGHPTSVVPQVTEGENAGEYDISPLYLFMPGLGEITIRAEWDETTDSAKFSFCVQG
jgi:hypothetical protein